VLSLNASGWTYVYTFVLFDWETMSLWLPVDVGPQNGVDSCGCSLLGIAGEYTGLMKYPLESTLTTWNLWYADHPDSWVLKNPGIWPWPDEE